MRVIRYRKDKKKDISSSCTEPDRKCVICDRTRESCGERTRVLCRISEYDRATLFLDALKFYNDEVMTRCDFLNTAGDVFAADILYHRNYLRQYLLKYNRQVVVLFDLNCRHVFHNLDFNTNSFSLSHIRFSYMNVFCRLLGYSRCVFVF